MGSNLVIVAIPDENDRVWKVSSEKIPHLTLLYLGDSDQVSNVQQIVEFVEHAANTTLKRFYLPVDRRDTLGADEADVLFFKAKRYDGKAVRDFRAKLLQDNNIKTAYDSATQIDGPWLPHLTLGYPATPAKPDETDRDYGFYDVSFTKIAVWIDNYDGPEFVLKDWDDEEDLHGSIYDTPLASWGDITQAGQTIVEQLLGNDSTVVVDHSGVKGMKWGVRRDRQGRDRFDPAGHSLEGDIARTLFLPSPTNFPAAFRLGKRYGAHVTAKGAENKLAKGDKEWQKGLGSAKKGIEVHNKAADEIDRKLSGFNSDKRWKNADGSDIDLNKNAEKMNEYNKAFEKEVMNPAYANAAAAVHGSSPSGRYKFEIADASTGLMKVTDATKIAHAAAPADDFDVEITFKILRDANGGIDGFDWPEEAKTATAESMAQAGLYGETFIEGLMQSGVKGMRWGHRSAPPSAVAPTATSRVPHGDKRKTKIDTEGGENHPAHSDAIKVAEAKAKLAKSGPSALSNQELREVATRVQLEQQVSVLTSSKGKKFVTSQLQNEGQNLARAGVRAGLKKGVKRAGVAALI